VSVFLGSLAGESSPVHTFSPLLGAEIHVDAGATLTLDVDGEFEHGVLVDTGTLDVNGTTVERAELAFIPPGCTQLRLAAGDAPLRLLLLGGTPFGEQILMWWNFVGRTNDEIAAYRAQWQAEIGDGTTDRSQFGPVPGYEGPPIPAPTLPNVPLKPRS
jgi:redox-sensitive bicupin YhaK (pirin superfamily)